MPKILVIEDDVFLSNAYKVKLKKAGFEASFATDGIEGLNALETSIPDVILLDLVMPKKDGFETLAEIKKNPAYSSIPIVVASNLGQKEDLDRATQLGANDYIIKSEMSLDQIVEKIQSWLAKQASAPAAPPMAQAA